MKNLKIYVALFIFSLFSLVLYNRKTNKYNYNKMPFNPKFLIINNTKTKNKKFLNMDLDFSYPSDFNILINILYDNYDKYDGFIILEEKAATVLACVLSRTIITLGKPIVITDKSENSDKIQTFISGTIHPHVMLYKKGKFLTGDSLAPFKPFTHLNSNIPKKFTVKHVNPNKKILIVKFRKDIPKIFKMENILIDAVIFTEKIPASFQISESMTELRKKVPNVVMNFDDPLEIIYSKILTE